jgi:hypothetical protein
MSKRSPGHARHKDDFYATPQRAVVPLIPYLAGIRSFAEPCEGDGDLVRHLESVGLLCAWRGDIRFGQDALTINSFGDPDCIITNPPHSRDVMHRLIRHFQGFAPTWLLIDADWAFTQQSAPLLLTCTDVVPIGRVKWFADSPHVGKDNYAWFRFEARHVDGPQLHWWGRRSDPPLLDAKNQLMAPREILTGAAP